MPATDDAITQAHRLLVKLEEDPLLAELYQRHPGLNDVVGQARLDLVTTVRGLTSGRISRERALAKARRLQEVLAHIEATLLDMTRPEE